MWKSRTIFALCAAAAAVVLNSRPAAQAPDPRTLPPLTQSNLEYLGRYRVPLDTIDGQSFYFAQGQLAYNPAGDNGNGSFFMGWGNANMSDYNAARMVEVTIPEPSLDPNIAALPLAEYIQGFQDPTENHLGKSTTQTEPISKVTWSLVIPSSDPLDSFTMPTEIRPLATIHGRRICPRLVFRDGRS